ncbi:hypothetical protein SRHO_G00207230 [Serrasalmus rhombeus]
MVRAGAMNSGPGAATCFGLVLTAAFLLVWMCTVEDAHPSGINDSHEGQWKEDGNITVSHKWCREGARVLNTTSQDMSLCLTFDPSG